MTDPDMSYRLTLASLERYRDLMDAVVTIAATRRPSTSTTSAETRIEAIANRIRARVPHLASRSALRERGCSGLLAHLHEALFEDIDLGGDGEIPLHPDSLDLDLVLQTGRGLPIACSMIYCGLAERLGIEAFGIDAPGHFLVGVFDRGDRMVIDPFGGGRLIDHSEFNNLIHAFDEDAEPEEYIQPALPLAWLDRWLRNLIVACDRCGEAHLLPVWSKMLDDTTRVLGPG